MEPYLEEAIAYYRRQGAPRDQSALIALLREVQQAEGGAIPGYLLSPIAQALEAPESLLTAIIRRIPSLRLAERHTLELCAGPGCGKAANLAKLAQQLCAGKTTVTLRFVPCMRLCGKGPNLRWDGQLHHRADEALLRQLLRGDE